MHSPPPTVRIPFLFSSLGSSLTTFYFPTLPPSTQPCPS